MMVIGIAGHRGLPPQSAQLIDTALHEALAEYRDRVTGVIALADGADQLFVHVVLDQGGQIAVIVPAVRYRDGLPPESHAEYDDLIGHASTVHRLDFTESTSEAHMAASELMISMVSELLAVWDQQPARGYARHCERGHAGT